ncbi:MAG: ParB-like nuclease domain-containing protein [Bacteroidales bacterium]|nr:ParB-like nuclease domain-containing protein [Bacteroidales bacterium]
MDALKKQIRKQFDEADDKFAFLNELRDFLFDISPERDNPVDRVLWVEKDLVVANNYNPNSVAQKEMNLLYTSVREDGYTQPIVTIWDDDLQKYVIVDGFHRNLILRKYPDIEERCHGRLPIVVIDKDIDQRMASTVRHNRARGSHSVDGMVNILFRMMKDGCSEKEICDKLGLEKREFVKMKYITGFAKIFKDYEYSKAVDKIIDTKTLRNDED